MRNKTRINIVIISTIASIHTVRWAKYLSERGFDITVISSDPVEAKIPGVKIVECLYKPSDSYFINIYRQLKRTIIIRKILKDINPDIVHIHSFDYIHPLMVGIVNLIWDGIPNLVISTWGSDVINAPGKPFTWRGSFSKRFLLGQAKEITATSHFLAEATALLAPAGKEIHVIPFGVNCSLFSPQQKQIQSLPITVGFVKHLKPKYGPDYLIKAMSIVLKSYPQSRLIVVGEGPMKNMLKEMTRDLKIEKKVEFRGKVSHLYIPEILKGIDIFVMPSIYESFGVAAIEAQAMEIPVIATNVGGIPEVVLDGETGVLVEAKNVDQLAQAIIKLIENPKLRKNMGKKGREFVLAQYGWENNAALMEKLYQNIAIV